jgi:hypothetical protein
MTLKRTSLLLEQASGKSNSGCGTRVGALVVTISEPCAAVVTAAVVGNLGRLEFPKNGAAVGSCDAGLGVVSVTVSAGTVNPKIVGMVVSFARGAEVVAGSAGSNVEIPSTGDAVGSCAAGLGVAVSAGAVVNPKIVGLEVSFAGGAEVVASPSGSNVEVSSTGGAVVARAAGLGVVISISTFTGAVVKNA